MNKFLVIILLLLSQTIHGQQYAKKSYYLIDSLILEEQSPYDRQLIDSCLKLYHSSTVDTTRISALSGICNNMVGADWMKYQFFQYALLQKALKKYNGNKVVSLFLKRKHADAMNNLGVIYNDRGNIPLSLKYYFESQKINDQIGNLRGTANNQNNIGNIYMRQGELDKSLVYFKNALVNYRKVKEFVGEVNALSSIAGVYFQKKQFDESLDYLLQAVAKAKEIDFTPGLARAYNNIAGVYLEKKDHKEARFYYEEALSMNRMMGDPLGASNGLVNIGELDLLEGDLKSAERNGLEALEIAREVQILAEVKNAALLLSKVYEKQNRGMEALSMFKLSTEMKDSLDNDEVRRASIEEETKYAYEKKLLVEKAKEEKRKAIEQEEKEKAKIIIISISAGLLMVIVFLIIVFKRLKVTREQKTEIEKQKVIVEEAKQHLEDTNKTITDSIVYAKRIQSAMLPSQELMAELWPNAFVFYRPKDIVAGDFYWVEQVNNIKLIAAADCTGHGVPGAMVSVVCNNALNRAVREYDLTAPDLILNKAREIIIEEFSKSSEEVKDGMDIALCAIQGSKLTYAGAHNPLWIIRDGVLMEIKANKQPIGKFLKDDSYTKHEVELQKGDLIYLFSDGYVDQFGGEEGKKLKTGGFKRLIEELAKSPIHEQQNLLEKSFIDWCGTHEQLDDVCVIGIFIN